MIYAPSTDITFRAFYVESKVGKTGLTVTCSVYGPSGSLVTAQAATEVSSGSYPGLYEYVLDEAETEDPGTYTAVFTTATTSVDQRTLTDRAVVTDLFTSVATIASDLTDVATDVTAVVADVNSIEDNTETFEAIVSHDIISWEPIGAHVSEALTASVFTLGRHRRSNGITLQSIAQNTYYTLDGSTPTSSHGFVLTAGAEPRFIPLADNTVMKFLRAANGAVLQGQFVRAT